MKFTFLEENRSELSSQNLLPFICLIVSGLSKKRTVKQQQLGRHKYN
jgi:hypothetical protein